MNKLGSWFKELERAVIFSVLILWALVISRLLDSRSREALPSDPAALIVLSLALSVFACCICILFLRFAGRHESQLKD